MCVCKFPSLWCWVMETDMNDASPCHRDLPATRAENLWEHKEEMCPGLGFRVFAHNRLSVGPDVWFILEMRSKKSMKDVLLKVNAVHTRAYFPRITLLCESNWKWPQEHSTSKLSNWVGYLSPPHWHYSLMLFPCLSRLQPGQAGQCMRKAMVTQI